MIPRADIALAYELRHGGLKCSWKAISIGLGYSVSSLCQAVSRARRSG